MQKWPTVTELMNASSKSDGSDLSVFVVCMMCGEIGQNRTEMRRQTGLTGAAVTSKPGCSCKQPVSYTHLTLPTKRIV